MLISIIKLSSRTHSLKKENKNRTCFLIGEDVAVRTKNKHSLPVTGSVGGRMDVLTEKLPQNLTVMNGEFSVVSAPSM